MATKKQQQQSHRVSLLEVWFESSQTTKRSEPKSRSLGELAIDRVRDPDTRKSTAKRIAEAHVGRKAASVAHAANDNIVVYFRREDMKGQAS